ncbi:MAG: hypothetical protein AAF900_02470 [Bacteroidota bacterium]
MGYKKPVIQNAAKATPKRSEESRSIAYACIIGKRIGGSLLLDDCKG